MRTLSASGKTYDLFSVTGTVAEANKNMETHISGGGGGGSSFRGTGYTAPVSVTSTTVVHDQIFLVDQEGKEHSFQLQDFNIACRTGNELKVIWAVKSGNKKGDYIVAHNRTTGQTFYNIGAIRRMFRPSWWIPIGLTVILLFMGTGTTVFLAFLTWIAFIGYTIYQANNFKKTFDPQTV